MVRVGLQAPRDRKDRRARDAEIDDAEAAQVSIHHPVCFRLRHRAVPIWCVPCEASARMASAVSDSGWRNSTLAMLLRWAQSASRRWARSTASASHERAAHRRRRGRDREFPPRPPKADPIEDQRVETKPLLQCRAGRQLRLEVAGEHRAAVSQALLVRPPPVLLMVIFCVDLAQIDRSASRTNAPERITLHSQTNALAGIHQTAISRYRMENAITFRVER